MRINPISTNIINKTYNVKKTESAKINAQKPLSTDSVQFKAAPWYATEYNQIFWKALKAGDKRISRLPKFANTNFDKIDALYKSLGKTIKSFPSRLLSDDFHFIYKYYIEKGRISDLYRLKDELGINYGDGPRVVAGDSKHPFLHILNVGKYQGVFTNPGHEQVVLLFSSGAQDYQAQKNAYIYFSTDYDKDAVLGLYNPFGDTGRYQFYDDSHVSKYQFKSLSDIANFFPVSFDDYRTRNGNHNYLKEILNKL